MFFREFNWDQCFLCGASGELTGEHKIKASAIRSEFGLEKMVIGRFGEPNESVRSVQGPKSKNLHFEAKVCRTCNSERTQAADREFDRFHRKARVLLDRGEDPADVFGEELYEVGSRPYGHILLKNSDFSQNRKIFPCMGLEENFGEGGAARMGLMRCCGSLKPFAAILDEF